MRERTDRGFGEAEGRIESAKVTLKVLQHHGMRLDKRLLATALRDAFGEIWEP